MSPLATFTYVMALIAAASGFLLPAIILAVAALVLHARPSF